MEATCHLPNIMDKKKLVEKLQTRDNDSQLMSRTVKDFGVSVILTCIAAPQWFCLVPLTRFGPILRKKSSVGRNFSLVRATAETKIVLKHKLPNTDYRRCTR